jgi:hypothetical protein
MVLPSFVGARYGWDSFASGSGADSEAVPHPARNLLKEGWPSINRFIYNIIRF